MLALMAIVPLSLAPPKGALTHTSLTLLIVIGPLPVLVAPTITTMPAESLRSMIPPAVAVAVKSASPPVDVMYTPPLPAAALMAPPCSPKL